MLPPAADLAGGDPETTVLAGLTLRRRVQLAAARAGFARSATPGDAAAGTRRIVLLPAHVVPQAGWLRQLRELPLEPETACVDSTGTVAVETRHPERVLGAAAHAATPAALAAALRDVLSVVPCPLGPGGRFALAGEDSLVEAEAWLLRSLVKDNEAFMSRHLERPISLAITRRLVAMPITPNAMTLVSLAIGLAGAACFLSAQVALQFTGSLLFLAHSILDGCDGEIARLKFLESRAGAILDFWGDNIVHVAVFGCMAAGWSLDAAATWPLGLGALAVAGTLGSAALASQSFIERLPLAPDSMLGRFTAALSGRDFIYLVVALAAFGKAWWMLVLAAAGAPAFLLLLWVAQRRLAH